MDMNKESRRFSFFYVDSIRKEAEKNHIAIQNALSESKISNHTIKDTYIAINSCGSLMIRYNFYYLMTTTIEDQPYWSYCMIKNGSFASSIRGVTPVKDKVGHFAADYQTREATTNSWKTNTSNYYFIDPIFLIEKDLGYVNEDSERYSALLIKVY